MRARLLLLVAALGAAVTLAAARPAGPRQDPASQPPVFRSGVDLVRLDIRVTDDDGRPITDLRAGEVQIEEEGQARPVLLFQRVEAPRGTYAQAAQRTIGAEVSTNQGSPRGHIYVLVFDQSHILPGREQRARLAAERFLRTRVRPGDRVALYALPGPGPQIEFTADVFRVLGELTAVRGTAEETGTGAAGGTLAPMRTYEAYEIVRGNLMVLERQANLASENRLTSDTRPTRPRAAALTEEDGAAVRRALIEDARMLVARADDEARRFLLALADLIRTLRTVDGRKSVILFSEGFQIDNVTHELESVAAAAAQSYSVVYAMDLNPRIVDAAEESPRGGEQVSEIRDRLQVLGSLTVATAGTLVPDASVELDRAMARIAETMEDYYLVGFTPASGGQADRDRYRRIRVIVTRPGARVSARTGYALGSRATPADRRRSIDAALRAPYAQLGLQVEYTTYTLGGTAPDLQRVIVSLAAELPVASPDTKVADVVYVVRDVATGRVAASGSDRMALPGAPRDNGAAVGTGLHRVQFELPAGTYLMRAVVREPGGLVGSADRRFSVRSLGGPGIEAGDLVIGSSDSAGLPVRATVYGSEALSGVMELYGRTAAQLESVSVDVDLLPLGGATALRSGRADLQEIKSSALGSSRGVRIDLPLEGVPPGQYLARATVRNGRESVAEVLRDFIVASGSRPAAAAAPAPPAVDPAAVLEGEVARHYLGAIKERKAGPLDARVLEGFAQFERRDYASAAATWSQCLDAESANAPLAFLLGWAQAGAGDERAAIGAWRAAIVADAALVPAYLALIEGYLRLEQPSLALQVAQSGVRAVPDSVELRDRLLRLERR